jgi:hypothetical protein
MFYFLSCFLMYICVENNLKKKKDKKKRMINCFALNFLFLLFKQNMLLSYHDELSLILTV